MSESPNGVLPNAFEKWFCDRMEHLARFLSRIGITPNTITLVSLVFGVIAGILLAMDHKLSALLLFIAMGLFDILDGQIAVYTGQTSAFGAILDSTVDRYNEAFIFMGLGIYYYLKGLPLWTLMTVFALTGSMLVSYVKARAEGMNIPCRVGLLQRSERLVFLGFGILFQGWVMKTVVLVLAVFTNITVVQRLTSVRKYTELS